MAGATKKRAPRKAKAKPPPSKEPAEA